MQTSTDPVFHQPPNPGPMFRSCSHETLHTSRLGRSLFLASLKTPKCTKAFIQKPTLLSEVAWGCEYDMRHFKTKLMKNNEKNEETSRLSIFCPFSLKPAMLKFYPRNLLWTHRTTELPSLKLTAACPWKSSFQPFPFLGILPIFTGILV